MFLCMCLLIGYTQRIILYIILTCVCFGFYKTVKLYTARVCKFYENTTTLL